MTRPSSQPLPPSTGVTRLPSLGTRRARTIGFAFLWLMPVVILGAVIATGTPRSVWLPGGILMLAVFYPFLFALLGNHDSIDLDRGIVRHHRFRVRTFERRLKDASEVGFLPNPVAGGLWLAIMG